MTEDHNPSSDSDGTRMRRTPCGCCWNTVYCAHSSVTYPLHSQPKCQPSGPTSPRGPRGPLGPHEVPTGPKGHSDPVERSLHLDYSGVLTRWSESFERCARVFTGAHDAQCSRARRPRGPPQLSAPLSWRSHRVSLANDLICRQETSDSNVEQDAFSASVGESQSRRLCLLRPFDSFIPLCTLRCP